MTTDKTSPRVDCIRRSGCPVKTPKEWREPCGNTSQSSQVDAASDGVGLAERKSGG
jgi:hypothetical protein